MKAIKQMLRQPIKFVFGLILMTLAAAIICVCVGQALAARSTAEMLEHQFTTIALPAGKAEIDNLSILVTNVALPEELQSWLEETNRSNPDVVKELSRQGILSAYIPELTPLNYTQGPYIADNFSSDKPFWYYQPEPDGLPYSCAMFVITLEEISETEAQTQSFTQEKPMVIQDFPSVEAYLQWYDSQEKETMTTGYTLSLSGTITDVVSLQEGYRDPTGMTARLTITVPTFEELEALEMVPGEQYLVYGMDYYDEDWALRGFLADERQRNPVEIDAFDLSQLYMLTEDELQFYDDTHPSLIPAARYGSLLLTQLQCDQINTISMTLNVPVPLLSYEDVRDEAGNLLEVRANNEITYTNHNGETVTLSREAYSECYLIPTIARMDGTVTDFIESPDGSLWKRALERDDVNNHAFAVMGVDTLAYLADFARGNTRITEGRDFTTEELTGGARVCIIHEALAAESGLKIGDTITLNLYQGDTGLPYQQFRTEKRGILTPSADFYFDTTTFLETASYTIVGCYRGKELWVDVSENEYGFSPNMVFVPKSSVNAQMEYPDSILFTTPVIRNGKLEEFRTMAAQAGYAERFVYYDQGYSTIASNFYNYEGLAQQVLIVGTSVYLVLLLLFLLLYPGAERKNVKTMRSLGVSFGKCLGHILTSSMFIVVPASAMGCLMGIALWRNVVDALQTSAEAALSLQIESGLLAFISATQFLLALLLNVIVASFIAAPRKMSTGR